MPHAFKAHPGHPAMDYLVRLHADLGGRIQANQVEAKRLAADMRHVEAVLKMFDPDYNVRAISARRRAKTKLTMQSIFETAAERNRVVGKYGAIEGGKQTLGRLAEHLAQLRGSAS